MWTNVDNRFPMAMIFDACMSQELKKITLAGGKLSASLNFCHKCKLFAR